MTTASGKPIDRILPTFVNQPGAPLLEVSLSCVNNRSQLDISQQRFFPRSGVGRETASGALADSRLREERGSGARRLRSDRRQQADAVSRARAACPGRSQRRRAGLLPHGVQPGDASRASRRGFEEVLSPPERLSLAGDEWALVRAGRHIAADYLTLASGFANEHTNGVLEQRHGSRSTSSTKYLTDRDRPAAVPAVRAVALRAAVSGDRLHVDRGRQRRAAGAACDAHLARSASSAPSQRSRDGARGARSRRSPAALRSTRRCRDRSSPWQRSDGDAALFDALLAASERATSPETRSIRYLYALAEFRDPALIDRALAYSLTSKLRSQDTATFFARFLGDGGGRGLARGRSSSALDGAGAEDHDLRRRHDVRRRARVVLRRRRADDIAAFFTEHPLPSAARTLTQTLERIDNCVALRTGQAQNVTQFLAK